MPYLIGTVALAAGIALANLVLALSISGRLRTLAERLADTGGSAALPRTYPIGRPVADFAAVTTEGETITGSGLSGWTLVGAMSPTCKPCHDRLPEYLAAARAMPGGRGQALAIVVSLDEDPAPLVSRLLPVARVIVERPFGPVAEALGIAVFPTFNLIDPGGAVAFGGHAGGLAEIPGTISARTPGATPSQTAA